MQIIHDHLHEWDDALPRIRLSVERGTLAKRRWRGVAEDGTEFGFDLEHALVDGDVFFQNEKNAYVVSQKPEPVLEVALDGLPINAAALGWQIGNLHFQLAVDDGVLVAIDDSAIRQLFHREGVPFTPAERIFKPFGGGHSHGPH